MGDVGDGIVMFLGVWEFEIVCGLKIGGKKFFKSG